MIYFIFIYIKFVSTFVLYEEISDEFEVYTRSFSTQEAQTLWFDQILDHDSNYSATFKQRYYVNTEHYKPGGPAILYIGGEKALTTGSVLGGNTFQIAKENNGILFGLEHRYYGESQPFTEWTVENLKYLSSLNGVKDIGNFIKNVINPTTNKTFENTKWIAIGGSYPGSLSAWVRQEYPNDVLIGYASSAPVLAKEDFYEFDQTISSAFGSECANEINSIREYMDDLYDKPKEFSDLKSRFGCNDIEDNNEFLLVYADIIAGIVQYNSPEANPNIDSICFGFTNKTDIQEKLNHIINQTKTWREKKNYSPIRQWIYQCCKEYGYWQTAPKYGISTRSKWITAEWAREKYCNADIYGEKIGPPNTNFINTRFKALNNTTPQTIWVNGDSDPWKDLSISNPNDSTLYRPIYLINKGSHGSDLGNDKPSDSPELTETRKKIREDISRILNQRQV
ncbi:peptidase S28 [Conidiobolus coronatus NRRL 28638]|uniref:Peptidase S28 n=1 Tax=Conidiobolus coronatus (strain ATCC 28846 / CBS 209.66 / NRRL 28638) TaxID=796925 RepID=A0A137P174_CONC2|nr:peptidase S28 [Conidiobolus coronatus NRRL 28638]|eukprot:KXN68793.1 peptidase S28 [Conidiobolus coronatus NRRL 28638]